VNCRLFFLRFNLIMLVSVSASNFFTAFRLYADARLRARLRCNNGLLVSQLYSLLVGILVNQLSYGQ